MRRVGTGLDSSDDRFARGFLCIFLEGLELGLLEGLDDGLTDFTTEGCFTDGLTLGFGNGFSLEHLHVSLWAISISINAKIFHRFLLH
jgi:hypothetical protein